MSVSLALIPVALALRVVMGKEGFESWVASLQVRMPTTFENELDLVRTVRKAGYDAEKWAGVIKTHIRGESQFFFWELVDGEWFAVFAKALPEEIISRFVADLESKSGRRVFASGSRARSSALPTQSFPTNFRDGQLLVRTLRDYGLEPVERQNGEIMCSAQGTELLFRPAEDGPFSVEVRGASYLRQAFQLLSNLDEDYKRGVQAVAYENLKRKVEEKNLAVESEEVLEDNSIVITLNVKE